MVRSPFMPFFGAPKVTFQMSRKMSIKKVTSQGNLKNCRHPTSRVRSTYPRGKSLNELPKTFMGQEASDLSWCYAT